MENIEWKNILLDVKEVAMTAGQAVMELYLQDYKTREKGPGNPVTEADLLSNKIILSGLERYGFGVLSEEEADNEDRLSKEYVWIIDPLDGTMDFIDKTGEFTIMIGLVKSGRPVLGVVYQPAAKILYYAVKNKGAFRENKGKAVRLSVSDKSNFKESAILMSRFHNSADIMDLIANLKIGKKISCGSAGLKFCRIASAEAEININTSDKTSEWDICAAHIILTEAGGKLSDINGNEFVYNKKNPRNLHGYVAANKELHTKIIKTLKNIQNEKK